MDEGFEVRGEFITLGQLLKALGIAMTGGEAKRLLEEGGFEINGEPEQRRGRKLRPGDSVVFPDGAELALTPESNSEGGDNAPGDTHHEQGQQPLDVAHEQPARLKRTSTRRVVVRRRRRTG